MHVSNRLCVGNGISATLPISDSSTFSKYVPHILTMMMILFTDKLIEDSTEHSNANESPLSRLLHLLTCKENFPVFAFPDLIKELNCLRHRIVELGILSQPTSPRPTSVNE